MSGKPRRRVQTEPAPGADPTPAMTDRADTVAADVPFDGDDTVDELRDFVTDDGLEVAADEASLSNDDRLNQDRPPHYA